MQDTSWELFWEAKVEELISYFLVAAAAVVDGMVVRLKVILALIDVVLVELLRAAAFLVAMMAAETFVMKLVSAAYGVYYLL